MENVVNGGTWISIPEWAAVMDSYATDVLQAAVERLVTALVLGTSDAVWISEAAEVSWMRALSRLSDMVDRDVGRLTMRRGSNRDKCLDLDFWDFSLSSFRLLHSRYARLFNRFGHDSQQDVERSFSELIEAKRMYKACDRNELGKCIHCLLRRH